MTMNIDEVFTPTIGNHAQFLSYTPKRHPNPLQLCHQITPIPDTPEPPTPEKRGQSYIFRPYDLPENPTTSAYALSTVPTVTEGLEDMSLHSHIETNVHVTGCLICVKPYIYKLTYIFTFRYSFY